MHANQRDPVSLITDRSAGALLNMHLCSFVFEVFDRTIFRIKVKVLL